jgi:hypothetical protein
MPISCRDDLPEQRSTFAEPYYGSRRVVHRISGGGRREPVRAPQIRDFLTAGKSRAGYELFDPE